MRLKAKTKVPKKERYLEKDEELLVESWVDKPERTDVEGVDTPKKQKRKTKKAKKTTKKKTKDKEKKSKRKKTKKKVTKPKADKKPKREIKETKRKKAKRKKKTTQRKTEPRWHHGINKTNLQRHYTKLTGLSIDTYDWESLDKSLTYSEAKKQIEREVGATTKTVTKGELRDLDEQQLYSRHEMRSEHAQVVDEKRTAKIVYEKEDPKTERWLKHPERSDVKDIDDASPD